MDLLALIIASFTLPAVLGALLVGAVRLSLVGMDRRHRRRSAGVYLWVPGSRSGFAGVPLSPYAKGWVSLAVFIGGLAVLAIATR